MIDTADDVFILLSFSTLSVKIIPFIWLINDVTVNDVIMDDVIVNHVMVDHGYVIF